jgi:thiamine-monophosphate kinase
MKVSELGQFGLIDRLARMVEETRDNRAVSWRNLVDGIGDDCAVWRPESLNVLAKVDCQVQNVHFKFDLISWEDLGWKALAVNLSDLAAMGGRPRYALVSLGLPRNTLVEDVEALYRGLLELARQSGTAVVGGNISGSRLVFIDINVSGVTGNKEGRYLTRSAARVGDQVAVTGWLGSAAAGLEMLKLKTSFGGPIPGVLKASFARPEPRLEEGLLLVEKGVTCALDISDGLLADLTHICQASQVGALVRSDLLPIRREVRAAFPGKFLKLALAGGEDYQLLFTARPENVRRVKDAARYPVTVIGEICAANPGEIKVVDGQGLSYRAQRLGWDHFKSR